MKLRSESTGAIAVHSEGNIRTEALRVQDMRLPKVINNPTGWKVRDTVYG